MSPKESSKCLIEQPIQTNEHGNDRIFVLGRIKESNNVWRIEIDETTPTVLLNEQFRSESVLINLPTIKEIQLKEKYSEYSLISGGTFIWINKNGVKKIICLKRSHTAETDPGYLTGPAGRCGEPPSCTIIKETNEELIIILKSVSTGTKKVVAFYNTDKEKESVGKLKLEQMKTVSDDIKEIALINTNDIIDKSQNTTVTLNIGNNSVDKVENAFVFWDKKHNTLEIRQVLNIDLDADTEIDYVLNGESIGREITLKLKEELVNENLVPALEHYYSQL